MTNLHKFLDNCLDSMFRLFETLLKYPLLWIAFLFGFTYIAWLNFSYIFGASVLSGALTLSATFFVGLFIFVTLVAFSALALFVDCLSIFAGTYKKIN